MACHCRHGEPGCQRHRVASRVVRSRVRAPVATRRPAVPRPGSRTQGARQRPHRTRATHSAQPRRAAPQAPVPRRPPGPANAPASALDSAHAQHVPTPDATDAPATQRFAARDTPEREAGRMVDAVRQCDSGRITSRRRTTYVPPARGTAGRHSGSAQRSRHSRAGCATRAGATSLRRRWGRTARARTHLPNDSKS